MTQVTDPIAETTVVVRKRNKDPIEVKVRIGRPILDESDADLPVWLCHIQLDGMFDPLKPVEGVSSFHALTQALSNLYSMFHIDELGKGRFSETGGSLGSEIWPDPGVNMNQFFGFDVAID